MTDVVWVALVSAGSALVTAVVTQFLAARAASKSADRSDTREALQWQRTEALRREELQRVADREALAWERAETARRRTEHQQRLKELWQALQTTQTRVIDLLAKSGRGVIEIPAEESASNAAAHVHAIAMLGLPELRQQAKAFYQATANSEMTISEGVLGNTDLAKVWREAYDALEASIVASVDQNLWD